MMSDLDLLFKVMGQLYPNSAGFVCDLNNSGRIRAKNLKVTPGLYLTKISDELDDE